MFGNFDFDVISRSWVYLFQTGMVFTLKLTALAMVGGIVLGTLLALMRLSSNRLISGVASSYVNLIRSIPLVLVIFWFYFLVPYIAAWIIGAERTRESGRVFFRADHLHHVRGGLLLRDHAQRHTVDSPRPGVGRPGAGHELPRRPWAASCCRKPSAT